MAREFRIVIRIFERDVNAFAKCSFVRARDFVAILDVFVCNSDEPSV